MKNIILLAPPAAGKGTLAKMLCDKYGYVSISTGDLLREESKGNEELRKILKTGKLISDELVFEILNAKLNKLGDTPYILDGFPRTVKQAEMYDELLSNNNKEHGVVIYLDIDKEELKQRVTSRIVCPKCKHSYSKRVEAFFPKKEGICDVCDSVLVQREDDTEEAFNIRYQEFLDKTSPLINYYEERDVLYRFDDLDARDVLNKIALVVIDND